jgi:RNA-binding protein NOB1
MGLRLVSVDGMAVRRVKQWARRCEACAKLVMDQERIFCPRCGNPYLSRVSISVDSETGHVTVYLSKNYRPRTRGCKYPLPKPGHAGRFEGELLLREDQLMMGIWAQKMKRRQKAVNSIFGSDITETLGMTIRKPVEDIHFGYGESLSRVW